uniref:Uncharacterized protein n=1 Tax=Schistocephalus solidus TaxID=70667 RepID=A0A0X3PYD2_SCHSO
MPRRDCSSWRPDSRVSKTTTAVFYEHPRQHPHIQVLPIPTGVLPSVQALVRQCRHRIKSTGRLLIHICQQPLLEWNVPRSRLPPPESVTKPHLSTLTKAQLTSVTLTETGMSSWFAALSMKFSGRCPPVGPICGLCFKRRWRRRG